MAVEAGPEGFGYRIRPVETADASLILELRTDPELGRFLNPTAHGLADQERWIAVQRLRDGDYYFAVESLGGTFEGVIGLYGLTDGDGEWGRWILQRGSLAAPASVLLLLEFGFERHDLQRIHCRTLAENTAVLRFHDSCAFSSRAEVADLDGRIYVEHGLVRRDWPAFRSGLTQVAERVARRGPRP